MDLQLQGKTAIVTGGSAGIGLAIARLLAEEGVEVTIPGRNLQKLGAAIASLRGAVHGIEADLGTSAGALTLIAQVPATDILVNNPGIYELKPFADISDEEWRRYFEVNLLGGIRLARHYFPAMLQRNWGRVIFVSSEAAAETPYGQKTRNRLYSSVYDPARAVASACMLPIPSRILNADVGGTDVNRTGGGGQAYGLEDIAGVHHGDG